MTISLSHLRSFAISAVKTQLRLDGIDLTTVNANDALTLLGNMSEAVPTRVYAEWYRRAGRHQCALFMREWRYEIAKEAEAMAL